MTTSYQMQFRIECPGCKSLTTLIRPIEDHDGIYQQGNDRFACQWCQRTIKIGWSIGVMAVLIENGDVHPEPVFGRIEPLFEFDDFDEEDEGETDEEDIISIN